MVWVKLTDAYTQWVTTVVLKMGMKLFETITRVSDATPVNFFIRTRGSFLLKIQEQYES